MHLPVTESSNRERVVIVSNATDNSAWQKAYCRICVYVPDLKVPDAANTKSTHYEPDTMRLKELEGYVVGSFSKAKYGRFNGHDYTYRIEDASQDPDPATWSHFLNVRIKFTILNLNKLQ